MARAGTPGTDPRKSTMCGMTLQAPRARAAGTALPQSVRPRVARVLVCDARPLVLDALARLVGRQRQRMRVVGLAGSHARALYLAERLQPDVLVLGETRDTPGIADLLGQVRSRCSAQVLVLRDGSGDKVSDGGPRPAGAVRILPAQAPTDVIVNAIAQVHASAVSSRHGAAPDAGGRVEYAGPEPPPAASDRLERLTVRERELIAAIGRHPGAKYLALAAGLGISEHTVHNHLTSIYRKLELVNRADLLLYAMRTGLVGQEPPEGGR